MNAERVPQQSAPPVRQAKPPPTGPAPPAPPAPPNHTHGVNGHPPPQNAKGKKRNDVPVDPATMYESLKSRIAALEEEEVLEEEEERRFAEEAQKSVKGLEENAVHSKYIELFAELKRMERDHAKEKQKLVKDKDAAKSQLTKANQTKTKMENLARELQKDNKRLREDGKRLAQSVEEAQEELLRMKNDFAKRVDKTKQQDVKYREAPDIVVKVVCRYRHELFFKISRKIKLSRLINSWTERMERNGGSGTDGKENGSANKDAASTNSSSSSASSLGMDFIFTYNGRMLDAEQTPEEIGIDEGDEIVAVELMDLTENGGGSEEWEEHVDPRREKLKKEWKDDPEEAKRSVEEIFDSVVRERLKEVLRQYELRERHFECVIRSKELEVLLSRARAAEQKQLAEGEKGRANKQEDENRQLRKDLEEAQNGQTMLIDKLIACCKEIIQKPNAERTQRLFASLREELERKGPRTAAKKLPDSPAGG
ncbi:hypothetical protein NLJ89_g5660 [Agrocybe chaxingu]|uniref:Ubiquitin-like domain-containing protein n=1 Tax=Agrocybe chaxingu TaxID=84603 RepID=A0A9W8K6Y3_9AGAR|nr:hypothetical protein NLJ89_g5660 [Agrocybe chaxingu]